MSIESISLQNSSTVDVSKVLRQTYLLLAMTLSFSALTAFVSYQMALPAPHWLVTLGVFYGLLFLIHVCRNSVLGLLFTFGLTGFMGVTIGPILNSFLAVEGGAALVMYALGLTAFVFFGLSAYVLVSRKDMSFLSGFIIAGFFVLVGAMALSFLADIPGLSLAISVGFVLFSSAAILFQTSAIIHGGETNYVLATITLYVSIYNLFLSLLNLLSASRD